MKLLIDRNGTIIDSDEVVVVEMTGTIFPPTDITLADLARIGRQTLNEMSGRGKRTVKISRL